MSTYRRTGTVASLDSNIAMLDEEGTGHPFLLRVSGPMLDYIAAVEASDREEKYTYCTYYYDNLCSLVAITVPSKNSVIPAKAVVLIGNELRTFGPHDIIDTGSPEMMSMNSYIAFCDAMEKFN